MAASETRAKRNPQNGSWLRSGHRWLGIAVAAFVVLLAITGIALNHSSDWKLDDRYISSRWLLDAYGVRAPAASVSFADVRHRVTLLGQRLYLDDQEVAENIDSLTGMVMLGSLVVVTSRDHVLLFTASGEFVESIEMSAQLGGPIDRIGQVENRAIVSGAGVLYMANAEVTSFERRADHADSEVAWSEPSAGPDWLLKNLETQYRGRGLSIERLVADLHSGRVVTVAGKYLMDVIAMLLVVLSITGIVLWMRPRKKRRR